MPLTPSPAQRDAIEAPRGPVLVVAGPGAGKTFCLIERIRFLIEREGLEPDRICAFTFTNKAAEEISHRLADLGPRGGLVKRGTIHAFCADLLRVHGAQVGLRRGFGIADEDYQAAVLARLGVPYRFQKGMLSRFSQSRFTTKELTPDDTKKLIQYERYLESRNVVDFDTLVIKAAALFEQPQVASLIASQYDYVLVDEFQDLNPTQYAVVRALVGPHGNVFAVGDDEQSIYSWAGADPRVFRHFANDFKVAHRVELGHNRRCPRNVVAVARKLMIANTSLFDEPRVVTSEKDSPFEVEVRRFDDDRAEAAWVLQEIVRDRATSGLAWGDVGVLYRTNKMGGLLEAEFLRAGIPCRMAQGRALADDPVVAYLIAALKAIAQPGDRAREAEFMRMVLPGTLFAEAQARAEERDNDVLRQLNLIAKERPAGSEDAKKIMRGFYELRNLETLGQRHHRLDLLISELLSQRVGQYRSVLEERHDELTDPALNPEVVALADRLRDAVATQRPLTFAPMGGLEIPLRLMLAAARYRGRLVERDHPMGPILIGPDDVPSLGIALGMFKALQYNATREFTNIFRDFTAFDIEATGKVLKAAQIVELAAVRVRDGVIVDEYHTLVNPGIPIPPEATQVHRITDEMVAGAPSFAQAWPGLKAFLGRDVVVAHNGFGYDFPLLKLRVRELGEELQLTTFDALPLARELHAGSRKLSDLAHAFGIDAGAAHRALDDTRTLAHVFLALNERKLTRARKTALSSLLAQLAVGIALSPSRGEEAAKLFDVARLFAFSQHSTVLEDYEREREKLGDAAAPTQAQVIDLLGGSVLMSRVRADKSADTRYPETMARLRRLLEDLPADVPLTQQMEQFLQLVVLSRWDGTDTDRDRVSLLTLHSTKGLEFPRVYIVGVADEDLLIGSSERRSKDEVDEARRLLYVGMTRTQERLVMTWASERDGDARNELRFLAEMGLA